MGEGAHPHSVFAPPPAEQEVSRLTVNKAFVIDFLEIQLVFLWAEFSHQLQGGCAAVFPSGHLYQINSLHLETERQER